MIAKFKIFCWVSLVVFLGLVVWNVACPAFQAESKNLVIAVPSLPLSLDPAAEPDLASAGPLSSVFDNLTAFDSNGKIGPALAESWKNSPDHLVWTFKLRSGVYFHDGTVFNAQAVVLWIDYLRYNSRYQAGRAPGYNFFTANFAGKQPLLVKVVALNEHEVQFTLRRPLANFLELLSAPAMAVTAPSGVAMTDSGRPSFRPIGTGPFQLNEWRPGQRLVLSAFPSCWRDVPRLNQVIFVVLEDPALRLRELERGNIDLAMTVPVSDIDRLKHNPGLKLINTSSLAKIALVVNCSVRPFNDIRGRIALAAGLPKKQLLHQLCLNRGVVGNSVLSPRSWAYVNNLKQIEYEPQRARRLLGRLYGSDHRGERELSLIYPRGSSVWADTEKLATFLNIHLKDAGFKVKLKPADPAEYYRFLTGRHGDLILQLESVPKLDPALELSLIRSNYHNGRISCLLEAARFNIDVASRQACYSDIQDKFNDSAVNCSLVWTSTVHAYRHSLQGVRTNHWGFLCLEKIYY
ncbi:MAG: ABC transporter substrate-binding protein [bacterium]|nr:ABC transporter substrate-binding protein [bacterium]